MIIEKTIYISEDKMSFDNKKDAINYDNDYSRLKPLYDECLGEPLHYPDIFCGYCLDCIHHSKENIIKLITELANVINDHANAYNQEYDKNVYNNILTSVKDIQELTIKQDIQHTYKYGIMDKLYCWAGCTYNFPKAFCNYEYEKTIIYKIINRLKNTSFITGIEYPSDSSHTWAYEEEKWDEFVKREKEFLANGGRYR